MQPDTITLAVDELNNASTVNHVFTRYEEFQNRATYIMTDHTLAARNTLSLYRTFPKVNGNFCGVAKTAMKFSRDISVTGVDGVSSITAPIIVEVSFSLPVGITDAQALVARQKALSLLDLDTIMVPLNSQLMV